jgi:ABC-type dipeptide/oligopeptide/nickel transport system ATPase subunit
MLKVENARLWGGPENHREVSFEAQEGQVLVLGGPSGYGKSSLAKRIAGVISAREAEFRLTVRENRPEGQARPVFMVMQNYEEVLSPAGTIEKTCRALLRMDHGSRTNAAQATFKALTKGLGLSDDLLGKRPPEVSGGQMQRFLIALGLSVTSRAIIFDESLSGLDDHNKKQASEVIEREVVKQGKSAIIIGHDAYLRERFRTVDVQF